MTVPCSTVYAVLWCDCVYESGYVTLSLHHTKLGAYRAMRKRLLAEWDQWNNQVPDATGYHDTSAKHLRLNSNKQRRKDFRCALQHKAWRITPLSVEA